MESALLLGEPPSFALQVDRGLDDAVDMLLFAHGRCLAMRSFLVNARRGALLDSLVEDAVPVVAKVCASKVLKPVEKCRTRTVAWHLDEKRCESFLT